MLLTTGTGPFADAVRQGQDRFGVLVQPRSYGIKRVMREGAMWAMDNDAFNEFDAERFMEKLKKYHAYRETCLFVVCPDVVGDYDATLKLWHRWQPRIAALNYPVAFVGQDGCVVDNAPWNEMDTLFIGGTDRFKDKQSQPLIHEANRRGLWVHVGRVNTPRRWRFCAELGIDSFDGTGFAIEPDGKLEQYRRWLREYEAQVKGGRLL